MTARDGIALLVAVFLVGAGVAFAIAALAPWGMPSMMGSWHPGWSAGGPVMAALILLPIGLLAIAVALLIRGPEPRAGGP